MPPPPIPPSQASPNDSPFLLRPRPRDLMLVDLDCFYASVERVRDPDLCGRPVIVGGQPGERGVVACASYEARHYGVHAGMPLFQAERLCPRKQTVFLRGDHAAYRKASRHVMDILRHFTPQVEPLSLDEAFLDMRGLERHHATWLKAAETIHRSVKEETGLGVSIGIGGARAVASVATAMAKPGGVLEVRRGEEAAFLADLPLRFLPGVGGRTRAALERFNLRTIGDLAAVPEDIMEATFGRVGTTLSRRARGQDADLDAHPVGNRAPKTHSISRETTLARNTDDPTVVDGMLSYLAQRAARSLREEHLLACSVGVRIRYADFKTVEKRRRLRKPSDRDEDILQLVRALWPLCWQRRVRLRLVGVTLHGLRREGDRQLDLLDLLDDPAGGRYEHGTIAGQIGAGQIGAGQIGAGQTGAGPIGARQAGAGRGSGNAMKKVDSALDHIRDRHGFGSVVRGRAIGLLKNTPTRRDGFHLSTPACSR